MKKFIAIVLFVLFIIGFAKAGNISTNNMSSIYNSCNSNESKDVYYYLDNGVNSLTRNPYDVFWNTLDSLISLNTFVELWRNGNVLTNCSDWNRVSNATVANDPNWVLAVQNYDGCTFNKPNYLKYSNPNKIDAQIHFNIKYHKVFAWAPHSTKNKFFYKDYWQNDWTCYPAWNTVSHYDSCPKVTVKYWVLNSHIWECLNYRIFWCGDGILNRPGGSTSYTNGTYVEECDPNDPTHAGRWNAWCSNTCKAVTQEAPTCSLSISSLQNSTYKVSWTVNWSFNPTQINIQPLWFSPNYKSVHTNVGSFNTVAPSGYYGPFSATMSVANTAGSNTCIIVYNIPQPELKVCWDGKVDRPNDNGVYEQCDNGPNFGNGCNNQCQLVTPNCNLTVNPVLWILWYPTAFTMTTNPWAITDFLNLWDTLAWWTPNIIYPTGWYVEYVYPKIWNYTVVYGAKNNYPGAVATWVTRPIVLCTGEVQIMSGCTITSTPHIIKLWEIAKISWQIWPDFNIPAFMVVNPALLGPWPHNIYYNTWEVFVWPNISHTWEYTFSINSHTIYGQAFSCTGVLKVLPSVSPGELGITKTLLNTGQFSSGDYVGFKIQLTNIGSWVFTNAYIRDLLPSSLKLISHTIQWISSPYKSGQWLSGWNWVFEYSWFNLQPWQSAIVYLTWQVRTEPSMFGGMVQTNWAFTSWAMASAPFLLKPTSPGELGITKTLLNTGQFSSGDYVGFKIQLTNIGSWVFTNAYIRDLLPLSLKLISHTIQWISLPYKSGQWLSGWNWVFEYSWFNLQPWQSAIVYLTWQVKGDASPYHTINWAFTSWAYDTAYFALKPQPAIQKYQRVGNIPFTTGNINIKAGDLITYKIDFANLWVGNAMWVRIVDRMPLCISYLSSRIMGVNKAKFAQTKDSSGRYIIEYSGFNLSPGQAWYVIITGQLVDSVACSAYTHFVNNSYIYFYNPMNVLVSSTTAHRTQKSIVVLTKDSDPDVHLLWDDKLFEITVKNQWPNKISEIVLQDIWPNPDCISYVAWTGTAGLVKDSTSLVWSYPSLDSGETLTLYISGHISDDLSCINPEYINKVHLKYTELWKNYTDQADYYFSVVWEEKALCDRITTGGIIIINDNYQWSRRFTCYSQNGVLADEIVLNCGNGVVKTGYNASSFTESCNYVYDPNAWVTWNTYNVRCYVDNHTRNECKTAVLLDPWYVGVCGNGTLDIGEECDLWTNVNLISNRIKIWNYLDLDHNYLAWIYGNWNYYCKECRIRKYSTNEFVYQPPQCLGVNWSISLMENELMPFWWRLWKRQEQFVTNYNCSNIDDDEIITYIDKNSMKCTFSVYDWNKHKQINDNPLHTFITDCYEKNNSVIFNYFEKAYKIDFTKVAGTYVFNTIVMFDGAVDTYWEYKLVLEKVDYNYCDPATKNWRAGRTYKWICEVDFALTRPYIMQISTFGISPVATSADFLKDFYDMKWEKLIKSTDIEETMSVDSATYGFDSEVVNQMNSFKNKYKSLAIAVDGNFKVRDNVRINDIFGNSTVKKVPNQMIFFVEWDGQLVLKKMTEYFPSVPFTVYIDWMDVLVEWSITTNGMIITTDKISFEDDGDKDYCEEGGQVVNGIFIAQWWFDSRSRTRNTSKNQERCPRGNLHVKWVLIGDDIDNLVNNRRSHLNDWFTVKSSSPSAIKRERKREIFEWAALLIEYNPTLWTQLPPWADSFTEILDVYRK